MRKPWIRYSPGPEENRRAAGAALAVGAALGAVVFYLARILLARERIDAPSSSRKALRPSDAPSSSGKALGRRGGEGEAE